MWATNGDEVQTTLSFSIVSALAVKEKPNFFLFFFCYLFWLFPVLIHLFQHNQVEKTLPNHEQQDLFSTTWSPVCFGQNWDSHSRRTTSFISKQGNSSSENSIFKIYLTTPLTKSLDFCLRRELGNSNIIAAIRNDFATKLINVAKPSRIPASKKCKKTNGNKTYWKPRLFNETINLTSHHLATNRINLFSLSI